MVDDQPATTNTEVEGGEGARWSRSLPPAPPAPAPEADPEAPPTRLSRRPAASSAALASASTLAWCSRIGSSCARVGSDTLLPTPSAAKPGAATRWRARGPRRPQLFPPPPPPTPIPHTLTLTLALTWRMLTRSSIALDTQESRTSRVRSRSSTVPDASISAIRRLV
jgi:hypothetical protein